MEFGRTPQPPTPSYLRYDLEAAEPDTGLSTFYAVRPRLFGIAYRMLGSAAEAEDIVQDVWLRWQSANRRSVENPPAFLAKTTTRLCINLAHSARARRETCAGTWLPEPADISGDPGLAAERGEALSRAVLLLVETLSPSERAAYILREAFDYSYRKIAEVLRMQEANVRQLVSRARKHIAGGRRASVKPGEPRRLLAAFIAAAHNGDMAALEGLFAQGVSSFPPQTVSDVYCYRRFAFLEGHNDCPKPDKSKGGRSERRQHSRSGILGRVEDITYSAMRQYGMPAALTSQGTMNLIKEDL